MLACICCAFMVCFIIGLPTFLCGCNKNVNGSCLSYTIVSGTVTGYGVDEHLCSYCSCHNKNGCCGYTYYTCYDSYVDVTYGSNDTCYMTTANDYRSKSEAVAESHDYVRGEHLTLYKSKTTHECFEESNVVTLWWYVGVVFLSVAGFILLLTGIMCCVDYVQTTEFVVPTIEIPTISSWTFSKVPSQPPARTATHPIPISTTGSGHNKYEHYTEYGAHDMGTGNTSPN